MYIVFQYLRPITMDPSVRATLMVNFDLSTHVVYWPQCNPADDPLKYVDLLIFKRILFYSELPLFQTRYHGPERSRHADGDL